MTGEQSALPTALAAVAAGPNRAAATPVATAPRLDDAPSPAAGGARPRDGLTSAQTPGLSLDSVRVSFGDHVAVRNVTLAIPSGEVTALIGPSGCGKTTLLRALNRLHDHTGGRVEGSIRLGDLDLYAPGTRPELVRTRIGMVFQRPNPFPAMSIFENVVSGLRFNGVHGRALLRDAAESALHHAALWDVVKDRLHQPAVRLSGGQQQRLCIARALAVEPEILLMDEPCSALDPIATAKIEDLITHLASEVTIVLVTHNMFQAHRVAGRTAVFLLGEDRVGELVEVGPTAEIFASPRDDRTRAYVTGEVG
ncbi:MAG: phosphate ABC transporter ATP-binding protein [Candidatus Dormibacteria bacterium]|jgi:phosphate transport system ATP-binding protein|nr:phosphate ABC transporter ATP-binding protein [Chloroflexota bacterium]HBV93976.1 phosphate ABC transporter ATP-binding protein [Chloroflexota bacterium]